MDALSGIPTVSSWYMNPFFAAAFGAAAALGLIFLGLGYIIFVKLRYATEPPGKKDGPDQDRCSICGITQEMLQTFACKAHGELAIRVSAAESWLRDQRQDVIDLRKRVDEIERSRAYARSRRERDD
jgi:hypothetical protein